MPAAPLPKTPDAAAAFLQARLGSDPGPVEEVGAGAWSRCFGYRDGGAERVVRFGRHRQDFEKDRRAVRFRAPGLPVPEVHAIGRAGDGWFAISTRAFGEPLEALPDEGWRATLPSLIAALDALRSCDLSGTAGFGEWDAGGRAPFASWRDFLLAVDRDRPAMRTHGWHRRLVESPLGDASFRRGLECLEGVADAAPPAARSLVHADLINRNVLVGVDHRIAAVLDWGCSLYGDFLYDLAWLEIWAPWHPPIEACEIRDRAVAHWTTVGLEVPDLEPRMRACLLHIALVHLAYNAWTGDHEALLAVDRRMASLLDP